MANADYLDICLKDNALTSLSSDANIPKQSWVDYKLFIGRKANA